MLLSLTLYLAVDEQNHQTTQAIAQSIITTGTNVISKMNTHTCLSQMLDNLPETIIDADEKDTENEKDRNTEKNADTNKSTVIGEKLKIIDQDEVDIMMTKAISRLNTCGSPKNESTIRPFGRKAIYLFFNLNMVCLL